MLAIVLYLDRDDAGPVWLEVGVAGADLYSDAFLKKGRQLLVDHGDRGSLVVVKVLLGYQ